jgi:hypothetical protein
LSFVNFDFFVKIICFDDKRQSYGRVARLHFSKISATGKAAQTQSRTQWQSQFHKTQFFWYKYNMWKYFITFGKFMWLQIDRVLGDNIDKSKLLLQRHQLKIFVREKEKSRGDVKRI